MGLGPIEVLEIAFPGSQFNGDILPELQKLIDAGTISVIDGLLVQKDDAGDVTYVEFDQIDVNDDAVRLADLLNEVEDLLSDEDVDELAAGIEPGSAAAILVFEHTWAKPFRDAVVNSGGVLAANFRVPGLVVDEVLAELESIS